MNTEMPIGNYKIEEIKYGYKSSNKLKILYNNRTYFVPIRGAQCCDDSLHTIRLYYDKSSDEVFEAHKVNNRLIIALFFANVILLFTLIYGIKEYRTESRNKKEKDKLDKEFYDKCEQERIRIKKVQKKRRKAILRNRRKRK